MALTAGRWGMKMKWTSLGLGLLLGAFGARAETDGFSYEGRLYEGGAPATKEISLILTILNPASSACGVLRVERFDGIKLAESNGYFSVTAGKGTPVAGRDPGLTLADVFSPVLTRELRYSTTTAPCAYVATAATSRSRIMKVEVVDSFGQVTALEPPVEINSVPYALHASSAGAIQGKTPDSFLQLNTQGAAALTQANVESIFQTQDKFVELQSLVSGASTKYLKAGAMGAMVIPPSPSMTAQTTMVAGQIWFENGSLKFYNGTSVQALGGGTTTGSTSTSAASLPNVGLSGTYVKVTTDPQGRVTNGSSVLMETDLPVIVGPGKVSGDAISSGTIGGAAGINTTGNLITSGSVSANALAARNLKVFTSATGVSITSATESGISVTAPINAQSYTLTLPSGPPATSGQVLVSDVSGQLSWLSPPSGGGSMTGVGSVSSAPFSAPTCSQSQTLKWNLISNSFECQDITLDASRVVSGILPLASGGTGSPSGSIVSPTDLSFRTTAYGASITLNPAQGGSTNFVGKVGIGTTAPYSTLHVQGPQGESMQFALNPGELLIAGGWYQADQSARLHLDSANGFASYIHFSGGYAPNSYTAQNWLTGVVGSDGSSSFANPGLTGSYFVRNNNENTIDSMKLVIKPSGLVGVGRTDPKVKLDVAGSVRFGYDATTCSADIQGALRLNQAGTDVEMCRLTALMDAATGLPTGVMTWVWGHPGDSGAGTSGGYGTGTTATNSSVSNTSSATTSITASITILPTDNGKYINYTGSADGTITLPALSAVTDGFKVTIVREVPKKLSIITAGGTANGGTMTGGTGTYNLDRFQGGMIVIELLGRNLQSVTIIKMGSTWKLINQTEECAVGQECWTKDATGGMRQLYVGTMNGFQYFTTPGGCTDSSLPTCSGGPDLVTKAWAAGIGTAPFASSFQTQMITSGGNTLNYIDGALQSQGLASNYGDTLAAKYCENMNYAGYTDWYLPAKEELALLYRNSGSIGGFNFATSSAPGYWSSTEATAQTAWYFNFNSSSAASNTKTTFNLVRCVRRF